LIILKRKAKLKPSNGFQAKMAILFWLDGKVSKVEGFVIAYKLYLRIRMRESTVKE